MGVTWFECPLPETPEAIGALRKLRAESNALGMRLAGLEELTHPDAFRPWLEAGCYDVVMPDVKYAGGISGVLRVAELAAQYATACAPHNPTGPVCWSPAQSVSTWRCWNTSTTKRRPFGTWSGATCLNRKGA
jgi:galactonate dehydratase